MSRFNNWILTFLRWVLFVAVLLFCYSSGERWLNAGGDAVFIKVNFLIAAAVLAIPGLLDSVIDGFGAILKFSIGLVRVIVISILLIFGGTTSIDSIQQYNAMSPDEKQQWQAERDSSAMRRVEAKRVESLTNKTGDDDLRSDMTYHKCVDLGVKTFKESGRYPYLSDGKNAEETVRFRCGNSVLAFGRQ